MNKVSTLEGFVMISPSKSRIPHYVLYLDAELYDKHGADLIAGRLDVDLRENPQYDSARNLDQLGVLQAKRVLHPVQTYVEHANLRGKNLGDIKPSLFYADVNLDIRFYVLLNFNKKCMLYMILQKKLLENLTYYVTRRLSYV